MDWTMILCTVAAIWGVSAVGMVWVYNFSNEMVADDDPDF